MAEGASGVLVLNKPAGVTSYDCVHLVKRLLGEKRVGHCGTLDPLAEGVLVILFGRATREQEKFLEMEKVYWLKASLGRRSTTGDREGEELPCAAFRGASEEELSMILGSFQGDQMQVPPRYAALKYQGRTYYDWARAGVEIPRTARPIHIERFELLSLSGAQWEARLTCSRGTYVRTLVEDVADRLGTGGRLEALVRERVGPYRKEDAVSLGHLKQLSKEEILQRCEETIRHHAGHV